MRYVEVTDHNIKYDMPDRRMNYRVQISVATIVSVRREHANVHCVALIRQLELRAVTAIVSTVELLTTSSTA